MFTDRSLKYTGALEEAMIAASNAVESRGLKIILVNVLDPVAVASRLEELAGWLQPGNVALGAADPVKAYLNALENLALLSNLLREHIKAGNYRPDRIPSRAA